MMSLRRCAFTLIELLVVIAIIAVLSALIFPVFVSANKSARKTNCTSNLKQIHAAFLMYSTDREDRAPIAYNGPVPAGGRYFGEFLLPFLKSREALRCPDDRFWTFEMTDRPQPKYPTHYQEDGGSYAYNGRDLGKLGTMSAAPDPTNLMLVRDAVPYHSGEPTGMLNVAFFDGHVKPVLWFDRTNTMLPAE